MTATIIQFPKKAPARVPDDEAEDPFIEACNRCMAQRLGASYLAGIFDRVLAERGLPPVPREKR
jgi:hypothetical protein